VGQAVRIGVSENREGECPGGHSVGRGGGAFEDEPVVGSVIGSDTRQSKETERVAGDISVRGQRRSEPAPFVRITGGPVFGAKWTSSTHAAFCPSESPASLTYRQRKLWLPAGTLKATCRQSRSPEV
jgi:hypothetical protein